MDSPLIVLRAASANRVYTAAAGPLARAEAQWVLGAHLGRPVEVRERRLAGMDALEVHPGTVPDSAGGATDQLVATLLGTLSTTYGVLKTIPEEGGGPDAEAADRPLLRPMPLPDLRRHPDDLETIQKYPGKTNEQFTALLVNLAAALSQHRGRLLDGTLTLLDPMCGRGTTLNRALRLGLSPIGAEIDRKDVEAYRTFLTTWLRTHRFKHRIGSSRLTVSGTVLGTRLSAELAASKRAQQEGAGQSLTVYGCDTGHLAEVLPGRSVDALVVDLPYGVQHGSHSSGSLERSPREVLLRAAPAWRSVLRDGAGLALAFNRHTLTQAEAADALAAADLRLISSDGAFRHRVDQSIDRDVLLAVPTSHPQLEELTALDTHQKRTSHE
ncbi:MAG TPA: hypothetical protein H9837_00835 [Candidatus Brachybacterium merdigallinarum]|nr:hypothetical protein [Candidatus Brachybacterium merdigallinarum]